MSGDENAAKGVIGKSEENGFPVIWKFVNELPRISQRRALPWLSVVSWKYDGSARNGMPPEDINEQMKDLENALETKVLGVLVGRHAYSRTGNHLKELVYYIANRDQFTGDLNAALAGHPRYPIEIDFYDDGDWGDFQRLLTRFSKTQG